VTTDDPMLRMVTALITPPRDIPPAVFHAGVAALQSYLQRRYSPPLSSADIKDVAADSVSQLFEASQRGLVHDAGNPTGYLLTIANRKALACIHDRGRAVTVDSHAPSRWLLTDEAAAARLDRLATVEVVRQAMAAARRDRDATVVRVATYLLDQIQRTGEVPSTRVAAEALGLSHAGVGKAMRRLRDYITDAETH
jgi:DNA-directed RNA polymerase specialized sigma24 family protein